MPNRWIREGFKDSQAIDNLTDPAECFYHRLLLAVDDAGRMDGRLEMLRALLFPLDISRRASDVEKQLRECVSEGLVIPYEWEGRPYVQVTKVQRSSPASVSKFPWLDGSFRIVYVKRDTRDGEKEFVSTSLAEDIVNPSASHRHPSDPDPPECTLDGTDTVRRIRSTEDSIAAASRGPSPADLLRVWNENRGELPAAEKLTVKRATNAKARLREAGLDAQAAGVKRLAASSFARGENARQWVATFDFFLQPDTLVKIHEGKYDNRRPDNGARPSSAPINQPPSESKWTSRRLTAEELMAEMAGGSSDPKVAS